MKKPATLRWTLAVIAIVILAAAIPYFLMNGGGDNPHPKIHTTGRN